MIKYKGKETNIKSIVISVVVTITFQLTLVIALYNLLKEMYIANEYLTIIITIIGLYFIKNVEIEMSF